MRHGRFARGRRRYRDGALLLAMVITVTGVVMVLGDGFGAGASAAEASAPDVRISEDPPEPAAERRVDGSGRVLLVGDSLMYDAQGAHEELLGRHGVGTRYVGFPGTGLLSGQGWWSTEVSAQVQAWSPDVVVIEACCNYAINEPGYETEGGEVVAPDSEEMFSAWAEMARELAALARSEGAAVYWVTTPCVGGPFGDALKPRVARFNGIADALDVAKIDWRTDLCPDRTYTSALEVDGGVVEVRAADGIHLAPAGNDMVAQATWQAIEPALEAVR